VADNLFCYYGLTTLCKVSERYTIKNVIGVCVGCC
jgi:hypothetical protein